MKHDTTLTKEQLFMRESLTISLLEILSENNDLTHTINHILQVIKNATRVEAVGIRLRDNDDYPYFSQDGFPNDFLFTENSLVARKKDGTICKNSDGTPKLECTCGLVLSGLTDKSNPLFTEGGSAWTNDSLPFLDISVNQDIRLTPRNQCIHKGYKSVALIPIRNNKKIIGLLQLNDHRKDCFSLDTIHFLEVITRGIGVAIIRIQEETAHKMAEVNLYNLTLELKEVNKNLTSALENVKVLKGLLPICARCKKIRDDKGYWNQIEEYISIHTDADFTHSLCPDCAKELYPELYNSHREQK